MGIQGLLKLIDDNLHACCVRQQLSGAGTRIVVDGSNVLHELYRQHKLDWANGGEYSEQRRVTVDFFNALQQNGARAIVVMDGGGVDSNFSDVAYRRNRSIVTVPQSLREEHQNLRRDSRRDSRHVLPTLSRIVFAETVEELDIPLYVADGKAIATAVRLANHYNCPVLGNDTNYCVCNLRAGFIHYQYVELRDTHVSVFHRRSFAQHFGLRDPNLCLAITALLGDGGDMSVPYLYHGAIKRFLEPQAYEGEYRLMTVIRYLNTFRSFQQFKDNIRTMPFGRKPKEALQGNCQKAEMLYSIPTTMSCEDLRESTEIKCLAACDLPKFLLQRYRKGHMDNLVVDIPALGSCLLSYQVGDPKLPPVVEIGRPIRKFFYGLLSPLMGGDRKVVEFHRNKEVRDERELKYEGHTVTPICDQFQDISAANIEMVTKDERESLAKDAICSVLHCPLAVVAEFDNWEESGWMLVVAATRYWATNRLVHSLVPNHSQLVKSLVFSFVSCASRHPSPIVEDGYEKPHWLRAYHAYLQWQLVYFDLLNLNQLLMEPFESKSPSLLFNGPMVLYYATHESPDLLDTMIYKMNHENRKLFKKLFTAILPQ